MSQRTNVRIAEIASTLNIQKYILTKILSSDPELKLSDDIEIWKIKVKEYLTIQKEKQSKVKIGIVYVVRCDIFRQNIYKIGRCVDLIKRMVKLDYDCLGADSWINEGNVNRRNTKIFHYPIFSWNVDNYIIAEKQLHEIFKSYRLRGELFEIPLEILIGECHKFESKNFIDYQNLTP